MTYEEETIKIAEYHGFENEVMLLGEKLSTLNQKVTKMWRKLQPPNMHVNPVRTSMEDCRTDIIKAMAEARVAIDSIAYLLDITEEDVALEEQESHRLSIERMNEQVKAINSYVERIHNAS
jgi:tetrahydromethanopterin S-methyltransferase subunit B